MGSRGNRYKSIRNSVLGGDNISATNFGETIRDMDNARRQQLRLEKIEVTMVYNPPLSIRAPFVPSAVIVGTCRVSKDTTYVAGVSADWSFVGEELRINKLFNASASLGLGVNFDLTFILIG
jgi:hypothetical protein